MSDIKDFNELMQNLFTPEEIDRLKVRLENKAREDVKTLTRSERIAHARESMYKSLADAAVEFIAQAASAVEASKNIGLTQSEDEGWQLVSEIQNIYYRQYKIISDNPRICDCKEFDALYEKTYGVSIDDELKGGTHYGN